MTAFTIGFLAVFFYFSEINTEVALSTSITRFRRGRKLLETAPTTSDAEIGTPSRTPTAMPGANGPASTTETTLQSTNIFSWRNVQYTVKISKEENRRLLDDISGYVAPGKLTALMGESGAGTLISYTSPANSFSPRQDNPPKRPCSARHLRCCGWRDVG